MRCAPYNDYKPSGVEWLGDVPAHWDVRRLKGICRLAYGDSLSSEDRIDGSVPVYGSNGQVGFHSFPNTNGPCLIIGRKGSFGKVQYSSEPVFAIDTTFFVDNRYTDANIRWLYYLLGWLKLDAVSKDSAVPGLNREDVYQHIGFYPPLAEQTAIVRYLDYTDERIRRYISSRERLIELLEEYRQVVIQDAVTRGLDPDVRLKPSGVEWLGDVPAHWEVRRLKFSVENVIDQTQKRKEHEIYLAMEHVENWTGRYSDAGTDVAFDSQVKQFRAGDVLFGKLRPYLAKITRPNRAGVCVGEFLVLRPHNYVMSSSYLERLMCSKPIIDAINASTFGAKMPRADWQFIGGMAQPLPPLAEQIAIAEYLDKATADIDAAIDRARREIELLGEYRTRLIADVVTGQVDVREAVVGDLDDLPHNENASAEVLT